MNELISVIVPVYNVKSYLEECLDSILDQTYKKLEIIVVDDGSNDGSECICDDYIKKDARIKVIHQENRGLSTARNIGMQHATGNYIAFVDSDDRIERSMYEKLLNNIKSEEADVVFCDYVRVEEKPTGRVEYDLPQEILTKYTKENLLTKIMLGEHEEFVWRALYRKELIKELLFEDGCKFEDCFWMYKVVGQADKIVVSNLPLYFYRQRAGSIINSKFSIKDLDLLMARENRVKYIEEKYKSLRTLAVGALYADCMNHYVRSKRWLSKVEQDIMCNYVKRCIKQYRLSFKDIIFESAFGRGRRITLLISKISFRVACAIKWLILDLR